MISGDREGEVKVKLCDVVSEDDKFVKTHLVPVNGHDTGITGFFSGKELLDNFSSNDCYVVTYEKDYGDGAVALRSFLSIIVDSEKTVEDWRNRK